ncbi:MAG: hypothetical protein JW944_04550, partial [Deltaproteobacteria bacterium]|nr:hypothetical protein [Deltaproteobacteria bacterium]
MNWNTPCFFIVPLVIFLIFAGCTEKQSTGASNNTEVKTQANSDPLLFPKDNFTVETITADNYDRYLLQYYLIPSANLYLRELSDNERKEYLQKHKWITW